MRGFLHNRIFCVLLMLLCLNSSACADVFISTIPTGKHLQESNAVDIACNFIERISGINIEGLFSIVDGKKVEGRADTSFGPGYQYEVDTDDDCWLVHIQCETHVEAWVVIHGISGRILFWQFELGETFVTYINMIPGTEYLPMEDAIQIAINYADDMHSEGVMELISFQAAYGAAYTWDSTLHDDRKDAPVWKIDLQYGISELQIGYTIRIDAVDGSVLGAEAFTY